MKKVDLAADIRTQSGNKQARKLRKESMIPAVLYEKDKKGRLLKIDAKEISSMIEKNGENVVVKLRIDGSEIPAVIKEVQRDPVHKKLVHVDFQPVSLHEVIHAELPIVLVNGERVEKNGWVIHKQMLQVEVEGEVEKIPANLTIDASKYKAGDVLRVADIEISKELSIINDGSEVIFSIKAFKEEPVDLVFDRTEPELVGDDGKEKGHIKS